MGALLRGALNAYFEMLLHGREKLHNNLKLIKLLSIFSGQPLDIELGYSFIRDLSSISTCIFCQLKLGSHKPCVSVGFSNLFCVRLS